MSMKKRAIYTIVFRSQIHLLHKHKIFSITKNDETSQTYSQNRKQNQLLIHIYQSKTSK